MTLLFQGFAGGSPIVDPPGSSTTGYAGFGTAVIASAVASLLIVGVFLNG